MVVYVCTDFMHASYENHVFSMVTWKYVLTHRACECVRTRCAMFVYHCEVNQKQILHLVRANEPIRIWKVCGVLVCGISATEFLISFRLFRRHHIKIIAIIVRSIWWFFFLFRTLLISRLWTSRQNGIHTHTHHFTHLNQSIWQSNLFATTFLPSLYLLKQIVIRKWSSSVHRRPEWWDLNQC